MESGRESGFHSTSANLDLDYGLKGLLTEATSANLDLDYGLKGLLTEGINTPRKYVLIGGRRIMGDRVSHWFVAWHDSGTCCELRLPVAARCVG